MGGRLAPAHHRRRPATGRARRGGAGPGHHNAGDAGRALSRFSRRAGEQTLALLSYAVRHGWETAGQLWEAGWETAGPLALEWTEAGRRAAIRDFVLAKNPGYYEFPHNGTTSRSPESASSSLPFFFLS